MRAKNIGAVLCRTLYHNCAQSEAHSCQQFLQVNQDTLAWV